MKTIQTKDILFQRFSWILFLLIFAYLLLRAFFLAPLHDETATFLHFIEPNKIIGEGVVQDANNHLLNSFLGRWMYLIAGPHFFALRLPSVLAFAVYFWGIYQLVKTMQVRLVKFLVFLALVSVAYVNDYFAYTRGYGLGMAFFSWILVYCFRWIRNPNWKNLGALYLFCWLAIFANLTFLLSVCISIGIVFLIYLIHFKSWNWKKHVTFFLIQFVFMLALLPFLYFSYMLKKGGALYYGSLDGFWEVTGKSLSRYVLFYEADWQQWLWMLLLVSLAFFSIYQLVKNGVLEFLSEKFSIFSVFLLGHVIAIYLMAWLLQVNYPEDRAGMYLIPLILLTVGFLLEKFPKIKWISLGFLFFPITFIAQLNFNTSVFTPDERIDESLFKAIKRQISSKNTFLVYHTMLLNWDFAERHGSKIHIQPAFSTAFSPYYDFVLMKRNLIQPADLKLYDVLHEDLNSGILALKRKQFISFQSIHHLRISDTISSAEYVNLGNISLPLKDVGSFLKLQLSGNVKLNRPATVLQLVVSTFDASGQPVSYMYYDQRWIHGIEALNYTFDIAHLFPQLSNEEKEIRIYLWNPTGAEISLSGAEMDMLTAVSNEKEPT